MGAGSQKEQGMVRSSEFSDPPSFPREGGGATNGVNNGSCLLEDAPPKSQWYGVQRAFQVGELGEEGRVALCFTSHIPCPIHLFL